MHPVEASSSIQELSSSPSEASTKPVDLAHRGYSAA